MSDKTSTRNEKEKKRERWMRHSTAQQRVEQQMTTCNPSSAGRRKKYLDSSNG